MIGRLNRRWSRMVCGSRWKGWMGLEVGGSVADAVVVGEPRGWIVGDRLQLTAAVIRAGYFLNWKSSCRGCC